MKIDSRLKNMVRFIKNKAGFAVDTAIKVLTAVVLGALVLMGIYGIINGAVMPKTKEKMDSLYAITDAGVDMGGAGGGGAGGSGGAAIDENLNPGLVNKDIPIGGEYYVSIRNSNVGEYFETPKEVKFPASPTDGDIYVYGDYEYRYNKKYEETRIWGSAPEQNGWGVRVLNTEKSTYGKILESINGKPITGLEKTFFDCRNMTKSPVIPNGVISMYGTYSVCTALQEIGKIPESVTKMGSTFSRCEALTTAPELPKNVQNISCIFWECKGLKTACVIPSSVNDMSYAFIGCSNLKGTIQVDALSLDDFTNCFKNAGSTAGCIQLTGSSTKLSELAGTNSNGNVVVGK